MPNLEGCIALVTGASGGIGQAIVSRLSRDGATVIGTDLEGADVAGDLTDVAFVEGLVDHVISQHGRLDILCNNAGIIARGEITTQSDQDFKRSFAINVEAPFRLCRAAIPVMAQQGGGAIVNTGSCWGIRPGPNHPIYVMSKAAIASMTQCLARDHAHQGIRVNAVCPNEVNTPMLRTGFEARGFDLDTAINQLNESVPLGRIAEPADVADCVAFLCSDDARYVCGALLEVNGAKPVV